MLKLHSLFPFFDCINKCLRVNQGLLLVYNTASYFLSIPRGWLNRSLRHLWSWCLEEPPPLHPCFSSLSSSQPPWVPTAVHLPGALLWSYAPLLEKLQWPHDCWLKSKPQSLAFEGLPNKYSTFLFSCMSIYSPLIPYTTRYLWFPNMDYTCTHPIPHLLIYLLKFSLSFKDDFHKIFLV